MLDRDETNLGWRTGTAAVTGTNAYKWNGTEWAAITDPWSSETNVTAVSITYDSVNSDLVAHIIKGATEQAYFKTTDATTVSWSADTSYGFRPGDLGHISSPMTTAGFSQLGVILRQGTNLEFIGPSKLNMFRAKNL